MDLALGFTSPVRRNSKMELPISLCKSKSYENSMPIHIPMESDSSSMFDTSGSCRITRWVYPQCGPTYSYAQKSAHFGKSGNTLQKMMLPKEPTLAISISQQTIVGGFVGSKTYAGRSMFGDSSQIWDAVVCKFVELMSLVKEKSNPIAPKRKVQSDSCVSGVDVCRNSQIGISKECTSGSESAPCSSKCVPPNHRISNSTETMNRIPQNSPHFALVECKAVVPKPKEPTLNSNKETFPPHRGTYSSVVDGTFKNECARSSSCTMVNLNQKDGLPESFQASLQRRSSQSYADVAKIIPNKPMIRAIKSGCEVTQNLKNSWSSRMKRKQNNRGKQIVNCQGNKNKNTTMDDIVSNGDTRWKGDWKSKKAKFQRSRLATPLNIQSTSSSETSEENSLQESLTKETKTNTDLECKWTIEENEPICTGGLKGLRGRNPSECSLDSEDSFVIFEECPDTALAASSRIPIDHNFSFEESDSEDDDSSSSSDDSDYEDDGVDSGEPLSKFDYLSSNSDVKEDCNWVTKCAAQTVPEKRIGMKKKMVHFAEGSQLAVVRPMIAWGYAYRESRRGPWEVHARDRARFHCRIASLAPVLNAILDPTHRRKVMASQLYEL